MSDDKLSVQFGGVVLFLGLISTVFVPLSGLIIGAFSFLKSGDWYAPSILGLLGHIDIYPEYSVNVWQDWQGLEKILDWALLKAPLYLSGPAFGIPTIILGTWIMIANDS